MTATRRAVLAARFLRPPGYMKRVMMREKPRDWTGPFENPVRKWVRLREKAKQFCELPPPRKIPTAKPTPPTYQAASAAAQRGDLQAATNIGSPSLLLKQIEDVPDIDPAILQKRVDFLTSDAVITQQLQGKLRPGCTPYQAELRVWERQMREIRRCYRAQYLQKLAEVTTEEAHKEESLQAQEYIRRRERKQAFLTRLAEDRKRRAILKDRLRVEARVTELLDMQRKTKQKKRQLYWLKQLENARNPEKLLDLDSNASSTNSSSKAMNNENLHRNNTSNGKRSSSTLDSDDTSLFDRNVSIPHILRQVGNAKEYPRQRTRRILHKRNVFRELMEESYNLRPEDMPTVSEARKISEMSTNNRLSESGSNGSSNIYSTSAGPGLQLEDLGLSGTRYNNTETGFLNKADRLSKLKQRAKLEYGQFSEAEKKRMLDQKIALLKESLRKGESLSSAIGVHDHVQQMLLDQLISTRYAMDESETLKKAEIRLKAKRDAENLNLDRNAAAENQGSNSESESESESSSLSSKNNKSRA